MSERIEEPEGCDGFVQPCGNLGSKLSLTIEQKFIGEFNDESEVKNAAHEWSDKNNYYPNFWFVSDHGNIQAFNMGAV